MTVRFPAMRDEVLFALELLGDADRQRRFWLSPEAGRSYPDLDWVIRGLFDTVVLPDPVLQVGVCVYDDEVGLLVDLNRVLEPLIEQLDDVPDAEYVAHPTWSEVVRLAGLAAAVLRARDDAEASRPDPVGPDAYADPHG